MDVFYYCYGSAHSSVVAAAIHLGLLPTDKIPCPEEFSALPHYDKTESFEIGTPFFMGKDEFGSNIYIIGMTSERELVKRAIFSFLDHSDINLDSILFVDALKNVNLQTKIGGFLSRRLGLVRLGRPLTIYGIQREYFKFIKLVQDVKKLIINKG